MRYQHGLMAKYAWLDSSIIEPRVTDMRSKKGRMTMAVDICFAVIITTWQQVIASAIKSGS
jgi:hypothetical protein